MKTEIVIILWRAFWVLISGAVAIVCDKYLKDYNLKKAIRTAVEGAEQLFPVEMYDKKREEAKRYLTEHGYDADALMFEIEQAVLHVKKEFRE